jgi:hypothetical protein
MKTKIKDKAESIKERADALMDVLNILIQNSVNEENPNYGPLGDLAYIEAQLSELVLDLKGRL